MRTSAPPIPHINLARRRKAATDPTAWLEAHAALSAPPEPVDGFILYESHLGHGGAHYEAAAEYPLQNGISART